MNFIPVKVSTLYKLKNVYTYLVIYHFSRFASRESNTRNEIIKYFQVMFKKINNMYFPSITKSAESQ
jgi:hypothetical protein